ncbi:hypothetical protein TWF694_001160 [Orbilia ellipsospora]|uniref:Photolyase/cryptochrome alpha/beta domain-containing protein n=1 Tax=Orbilia ellipsospora TaxID=2528407 RepID=A0AAV9XSA1_9PEZI
MSTTQKSDRTAGNFCRLDCQQALSDGLSRLNPNSRLLVVREAPTTILPKLFKAWKITHIVFEKDTDSYARKRDEVVVEAATRAGVQCVVKYGRTLWDSDVNKPDGFLYQKTR